MGRGVPVLLGLRVGAEQTLSFAVDACLVVVWCRAWIFARFFDGQMLRFGTDNCRTGVGRWYGFCPAPSCGFGRAGISRPYLSVRAGLCLDVRAGPTITIVQNGNRTPCTLLWERVVHCSSTWLWLGKLGLGREICSSTCLPCVATHVAGRQESWMLSNATWCALWLATCLFGPLF